MGINKAIITMADENYLPLALTTLKSFKINNPEFEGDFIIIDLGIISKVSSDIQLIKPDIDKYTVGNLKFNKFITLFNLKFPRYLNLFKLEIFKYTQYDKILFLDADTVVTDNIMELFDLNQSSGVKIDYRGYGKEYLNTGVMLLCKDMISLEYYNKMIKSLIYVTPTLQEEEMIYKTNINDFNFIDVTYNDITCKFGKVLHFIYSESNDIYQNLIWKHYNECNNIFIH